MSYQIKILLISFFTSLIISLIIIPLLRRLKIGQIEREEGPQSHLKKQGTPTMGRNNNGYFYNNSIYINIYKIF